MPQQQSVQQPAQPHNGLAQPQALQQPPQQHQSNPQQQALQQAPQHHQSAQQQQAMQPAPRSRPPLRARNPNLALRQRFLIKPAQVNAEDSAPPAAEHPVSNASADRPEPQLNATRPLPAMSLIKPAQGQPPLAAERSPNTASANEHEQPPVYANQHVPTISPAAQFTLCGNRQALHTSPALQQARSVVQRGSPAGMPKSLQSSIGAAAVPVDTAAPEQSCQLAMAPHGSTAQFVCSGTSPAAQRSGKAHAGPRQVDGRTNFGQPYQPAIAPHGSGTSPAAHMSATHAGPRLPAQFNGLPAHRSSAPVIDLTGCKSHHPVPQGASTTQAAQVSSRGSPVVGQGPEQMGSMQHRGRMHQQAPSSSMKTSEILPQQATGRPMQPSPRPQATCEPEAFPPQALALRSQPASRPQSTSAPAPVTPLAPARQVCRLCQSGKIDD